MVKGDANGLSSVWAIFTSFFSALTYLMTTLTHFWDPEVAFTLQLITSSAVSALEAGVPAAQIIELLPSVVFAKFDDAHREFRQLGRALPALTQTWENFLESEPHERFREVVMGAPTVRSDIFFLTMSRRAKSDAGLQTLIFDEFRGILIDTRRIH